MPCAFLMDISPFPIIHFQMLFEKELDKVYNKDAPEDDMMERAEEMERMREHVFKESDTDRNNLISFEEFLSETKVRCVHRQED